MNKRKGQMQIVFGIAVILVIFGIVLAFQWLSGSEDEKAGETAEPLSSPTYTPQIPGNQGESVQETPAETQTSADFTPPFRYNPQPSGGLPYNTKQVLMSLETNEKATCRYADASGFYYESMQHAFAETGGTFHSTPVGGLDEGRGYVYYVRCIDEQGNENTSDLIINFYVNNPVDFTSPERLNPYPSGDVFPVGANITISISTDEPADCRYSLSQGTSYNSMSKRFTSSGNKIYHTAQIKGLGIGSYEYFVRCKDTKGNTNTGDVMIYFSVGE